MAFAKPWRFSGFSSFKALLITTSIFLPRWLNLGYYLVFGSLGAYYDACQWYPKIRIFVWNKLRQICSCRYIWIISHFILLAILQNNDCQKKKNQLFYTHCNINQCIWLRNWINPKILGPWQKLWFNGLDSRQHRCIMCIHFLPHIFCPWCCNHRK